MNIPGFTAEASLYNVNERYQAITDAPHYGGIVQPAADPVEQHVPVFSRPSFLDRCFLIYTCRFIQVPGHPLPIPDCRWERVCR